MASNTSGPSNLQSNIYSEDDTPAITTLGPNKALDGPTRASSTSSLSDAQDPDADAEGEPDDLDADADGIEDDDAMDYSYEGQDLDGVRIEDGDDSGQEEEEDEEDAENEEDEEDDSGEEMDLDENASSPPPSPPSRPPSRISDLPHQQGSESNKKPLKLKLKLASQPTASRAPAKRKYVRKAPVLKSPSGRSRSANDKKAAKRRDTDEEDDELAEDSFGFSDGDDDRAGPAYQASNGSDDASTGGDTMPTVGQLTVRQRAKEYGEPVTELQSLPMIDVKKKKELTEADRAMEKAEKSRKRKHQNEKKLEDEKTETINRLLKGQIGKAGRGSSKATGGAIDPAEENSSQVVKAPAPPPLPTMIRSISSIRSGEYVASLSIPASLLKDHEDHFAVKPATKVVYPPPVRPPPNTWKLVNGVRVN